MSRASVYVIAQPRRTAAGHLVSAHRRAYAATRSGLHLPSASKPTRRTGGGTPGTCMRPEVYTVALIARLLQHVPARRFTKRSTWRP